MAPAGPGPHAAPAWYRRVFQFDIETLFSRKRAPGPPRTIHLNEGLPPNYFDHKHRVQPAYIYPTNQVITSKYTIITFLPRNLLEQFRRIANLSVFHSESFVYLHSNPPQVLPCRFNPPILPQILYHRSRRCSSSSRRYHHHYRGQGWLRRYQKASIRQSG